MNMKKIFTKILTVSLAGLALSSCNLDLFPEATIIYDPSQPFYYYENDVEAAHSTVYTYFRSNVGGADAYITDLALQGFNAHINFGNRLGDIHRTDESYNTSSQTVEGYWAAYYASIKNYNVIIEAAESAADKEFYDRAVYVKGEALIARAYTYLQLARLFGTDYVTDPSAPCVPLVLKYDQNERPAAATMEQVYAQIAQDLDDARQILESEKSAEWLPKNAVSAQYFTTDVISFLQARVLLDSGEYEAAADTAMAIYNRGVYSFSADAAALKALNSKDKGTEAIMQPFTSRDEKPGSYNIFIGKSSSKFSASGFYYQPDFLPSQVLLEAYDNTDFRRQAWFELTGTDAEMTPIVGADVPTSSAGFVGGVNIFAKYKGNLAYTTNDIENGLVAPKPFLVSELLLIAAEGYYRAGVQDKANIALKQLQAKRNASLKNCSEESLNKEWFRETIGEGLYMSYLKRAHLGYQGRSGQPNALSNALLSTSLSSYLDKSVDPDTVDGARVYTWPVPAYELRCNPNLKQNPVWAN